MKYILSILLFLPFYGMSTTYTWPSTSTNILINRANYPTLSALTNDTIYIMPRAAGATYRSFSLANINSGSPGRYIVIYWQAGAAITPNTSSPIFANSIDSVYGCKIVGFTMSTNIDVAMSSYSSGHYSQYVWWDSCRFVSMNGFFPSGGAPTLTTPNFTGDTTNCFYMWRWSRCTFDSLVGGNSGNTAIKIGAIAKNNTWVHVEMDHCKFGDYSSSTAPAAYIAAWNTYGLYIHDDSLWNLGKSVVTPVGHTQSIWVEQCYYEIWNCYFGPLNFGNCIRSFGQADIPSMFATFSQWSTGYNGRSRIYNCIDVDSRKYPFYETRTTPSDTTTLSPYIRQRTSAEVWFISAIRLDTWTFPNDAYAASVIDCYELDSLFLKGSYLCGPSDTTWNACSVKGCVRLITTPNGAVAKWDTANTRFVSSSLGIGLLDSTATFHPNYGSGLLYAQGPTSYPAYAANDYYGTARPATPDIGAVQSIAPASGVSSWSHKRKYKSKQL